MRVFGVTMRFVEFLSAKKGQLQSAIESLLVEGTTKKLSIWKDCFGHLAMGQKVEKAGFDVSFFLLPIEPGFGKTFFG